MNGKSKSLKGLKPNHVTERGLARTFQNIRLFQNMTVLENVMIGRHCRSRSGILGAIIKNKAVKEEESPNASRSDTRENEMQSLAPVSLNSPG